MIFSREMEALRGMAHRFLAAAAVLFLLAAHASLLYSGRLYVYRDERGVLHFTNVAPPTSAVRRPSRPIPRKGVERLKAYSTKIEAVSRRYRLDPDLLKAVIMAESGCEPYAVSRKGAVGLMQIMPDTATELGVHNPFDPHANIEGGAKYLRQLLDRFEGNLLLALAGYNAGPSAVERYGGVPPYGETRRYIRRVLSLWKAFKEKKKGS